MDHPITAIYDANVLYPAPIRDLFLRIVQSGLVFARWTERRPDGPENPSSHLEPLTNPKVPADLHTTGLRRRRLIGFHFQDVCRCL